MPGRTDDKHTFILRRRHRIRLKLIAGTDNVYICDDCIELCSEILEEEFADQEKGPDFSGINLLKPKEIKDFWMSMLSDRRCQEGALCSGL